MLLQEEISMPEGKKEVKAKPAPKAKVVTAKPASKPKVAAKPKAKAPSKPAPKVQTKKPVAKAPVAIKKAKKTRAYTKKPKGTFADLIKKQAELEEIKKGAKADLKKQYENHLKEAEKVKVQYKELFAENLDAPSKARAKATGKKKNGWKTFTLDQVQSFIDQTTEGKPVKIPGKNAIGVKKIQAAYDKAKNKDAESVLALLK
jgi:histone H1/5